MREALKRAAKLAAECNPVKRQTTSNRNLATTGEDKEPELREQKKVQKATKKSSAVNSDVLDQKLIDPKKKVQKTTKKSSAVNSDELDNKHIDPKKKVQKATKKSIAKAEEKSSALKRLAASSDEPAPLVSLGELVDGVLVRRPSTHNKSPYVADVLVGEEEVLAHTPMLDLGGLLVPGATVRMTKSKPGGKTSHAVQLVRVEGAWVGANPCLGNRVAKAVLERGLLSGALLGREGEAPAEVRSEVTMPELEGGETVRADFMVDGVVVEVKSSVCADFHQDQAPIITKKDRYVTVVSTVPAEEYVRTGLFPIGRRGQEYAGEKVVSSRCIKHLRHLASVARQGRTAALLVIVNRGDCGGWRACTEACPGFARELGAARGEGVLVLPVGVSWDIQGRAWYRGILPIVT